jgi:hypothetical protein
VTFFPNFPHAVATDWPGWPVLWLTHPNGVVVIVQVVLNKVSGADWYPFLLIEIIELIDDAPRVRRCT